mmetsp:Transcript_4233/g.10885  ORF Transcript_4233/g.10885 Transcript_4233/m.10885 type:complete len:408 (-) Transcript_4233:166-1389(-)
MLTRDACWVGGCLSSLSLSLSNLSPVLHGLKLAFEGDVVEHGSVHHVLEQVGGVVLPAQQVVRHAHDRRRNAVPGGELDGGRGGGHALGHPLQALGPLFQDLRQLLAAAQLDPDLLVPREPAQACQHQVADPGQPVHGVLLAPHRHRQPIHLPASPGDKECHGVDAEAEAFRHAGENGDDVLQGPAHLHPDHVLARVHPHRRAAEQVRKLSAHEDVVACEYGPAGRVGHDVLGKGRAGEEGHRVVLPPQRVRNDLVHHLQGLRVQAFGGRHDGHLRLDLVLHLLEVLLGGLQGDAVDDEAGVSQRHVRVRRRRQVLRQLELLEVGRVPVLGVDPFRHLLAPRQHHDVEPVARHQRRHRHPEGPAPEHGHLHLPAVLVGPQQARHRSGTLHGFFGSEGFSLPSLSLSL